MQTRREETAGERPFNNLLRRLNAVDFALIAPHLAEIDANAGDVLYSPGDAVEIVHFPCGPSLVSYLVPNEDGRDVETILIGREGAVGGIVSQGYLPAYTRIMVKFAGPFVRLPIGKLDAAKKQSATLSKSSPATPTACWPRSSNPPPATRSTRSNSARQNGSSRRWNAPTATRSCR